MGRASPTRIRGTHQSPVIDPVLRGPDYSRKFTLQTDASDRGIGAVLTQVDEEGQDQLVAFYSRKLLPRERNYAAVDKECLAIVDGIRHFQIYLTGVKFDVITDHKCLEWLDSVRDAGGRRTRWSLRLQPFNFTIRHRPGTENGNADGLSRQAWEEEEDVKNEASDDPSRPPKFQPAEGGEECCEPPPPGVHNDKTRSEESPVNIKDLSVQEYSCTEKC